MRKSRGTTFLEIVFAVGILSIAMIPIFGIMSKQTVETDKVASQAFAMNKASEILDTILDNVPFVAIRQGNPGLIKVNDLPSTKKYKKFDSIWAKKIATMLFPNSKNVGGGWSCRGTVKDSRGITYLVHLKVEDKAAPQGSGTPEKLQIGSSYPSGKPNDFPLRSDFTFSFLKNPAIISDGEWIANYRRNIAPCTTGACSPEDMYVLSELELDGSVAEAKVNVYQDEGTEGLGSGATKFRNPTAVRYSQHTVVNELPYKAAEPFSHTSMKILLVQVQWNLDQKYFGTPEVKKGRMQKVHLMTMKGDID